MVRGTRNGWLAFALSFLLVAAVGLSVGQRRSPPKGAPAPKAVALYVVPDGLVADADLDHGAGTDNAPAINAAVAQAQAANLPVYLPPGKYQINSAVVIPNAVNFTLAGVDAGRLGPDSTASGTWLCWGGAPNGTMISLRGIKCAVKNLGLCSCRNTSVDVGIDVETPAAYPNVSSQHLFENVVAYGQVGPFSRGWVVGADGKANNEFHWWRSCCTRYCTYAGIHVPSSTRQVKDCVCEDCTFSGSGTYADSGVVFNGGSMHFWRCNFNALGTAAAWFGGSNESIDFLNCTGETNRCFGQFTGCACVNFSGCRVNLINADPLQPRGAEFIRGSNLAFHGCVFEEADALPPFIRPTDSGTLVVTNCQFHCAAPFTTDGQTTWKGFFANVRTNQGNDMVPNGVYYQRNDLTTATAGPAMVLGSGQWPPAGTYNGGTYLPGPGEAVLSWQNGTLWVETWDGSKWAARQVQLQTAP